MKPAHIAGCGMIWLLTACSAEQAPTQPVAPSEPTTPTTLDLSREHLPTDDLVVEVGDDENLLPDLLGNESDARKVKLSGGVITDKDAPTMRDKIDGAEVKIEVKTP